MMPDTHWSAPTRRHLPIILIRGFGGLDVEDERALAYQGFNLGSVYPQKRGENYIYEGLILRLIKQERHYHDATNVVQFFRAPLKLDHEIPKELEPLDRGFFSGHKIVIDPAMALRLIQSADDPHCTLWVFRYYDLDDRTFPVYGEALVRLIEFIRALIRIKEPGSPAKVNIIAHSMGGLIVREAIQQTYPGKTGDPTAADRAINKVITLGTPHKGISFQIFDDLRWLPFDAKRELEAFSGDRQLEPPLKPISWRRFHEFFPPERLLTVVGTNYESYGVRVSSWANRLFSVGGEFGPNYNRSDGLVKQANAQIDGAPRTFVHKCHGGFDSLVTSRETYEIATRFLNGNVRARLRLLQGKIKRGFDLIGKSEFFFGVSIKPRGVDFELFHQSKQAENCYGPFHSDDFGESNRDLAFPWADDRRLIWEGYLAVDLDRQRDLVLRADFYVGERDLFGIGFSDNVVFYKQYYVRAIMKESAQAAELKQRLELYSYTGEEFRSKKREEDLEARTPMPDHDGGWRFEVKGTGFEATLKIELDWVPVDGWPIALAPQPGAAAPVPV
jgi:pimeloyl-ACP methyl ester carboxylesterase